MEKIKKYLIIIMILCLSCSCDYDPYKGKRPIEQANTTWICSKYDISFSVNEKFEVVDPKMKFQNNVIPFNFLWSSFDNNVNFNFKINDDEKYLTGKCKFQKDEFSIFIEDTKDCFSEKEIELIFLKK